jgi:D-lyxose ketol-isomerase
MLTLAQVRTARERASTMLAQANIVLTPQECDSLEVADFGLGELERTGLEICTYVNNDRYCAKELILFPYQTCPEHRHPDMGGLPGKMETFRCRWGKVYLYVDGISNAPIRARIPIGSEQHYTAFCEIELTPGAQYTIPPNTRHWFQADAAGAIVSEFSSTSRDEADIFTDPRIERIPRLKEA